MTVLVENRILIERETNVLVKFVGSEKKGGQIIYYFCELEDNTNGFEISNHIHGSLDKLLEREGLEFYK